MFTLGSLALIAGGVFSTTAGVAHLACIIGGAPAYRFLGAGEKVARAAEAKKIQPAIFTLGIACVLFVWAAYAFSGAGVIEKLPLLKVALPIICVVYSGRGIGFPLLKPAFPENSNLFWLVSSGICLVIGLLHIYGTFKQWSVL